MKLYAYCYCFINKNLKIDHGGAVMNMSYQSFVNTLIESSQRKTLFSDLFSSKNGYALSFDGRKEAGGQADNTYAYAESVWDSFKDMVPLLPKKEGIECVDLGSGLGKALVGASLFFPCERLVGYEYIAPLAMESRHILEKYKTVLADLFPAARIPDITIHQTSLAKADISNADIVFFAATCFSDTLIQSVLETVSSMKDGAMIISITRYLEHEKLECVYKGTYTMDWGEPTVYLYKKSNL